VAWLPPASAAIGNACRAAVAGRRQPGAGADSSRRCHMALQAPPPAWASTLRWRWPRAGTGT
jgi:hypothetical protein